MQPTAQQPKPFRSSAARPTRPAPYGKGAALGAKSATFNGPSRGVQQEECTLSHINRRARRIDFFTDKLVNQHAGYTFTLEEYWRYVSAAS